MKQIIIWAEDGTGRVAHREYKELNNDITSFIYGCQNAGLNHFRLTMDKD